MGFPPGGVGHSRVLDHLEGEIEAVNFSCFLSWDLLCLLMVLMEIVEMLMFETGKSMGNYLVFFRLFP